MNRRNIAEAGARTRDIYRLVQEPLGHRESMNLLRTQGNNSILQVAQWGLRLMMFEMLTSAEMRSAPLGATLRYSLAEWLSPEAWSKHVVKH